MTLAEIQKLVEDDASKKDLSKDQEQELIEDLWAYCDLKRTGCAHPTKRPQRIVRGLWVGYPLRCVSELTLGTRVEVKSD